MQLFTPCAAPARSLLAVGAFLLGALAQEELGGDAAANNGPIVDRDVSCSAWAEQGECTKNPGYMKVTCPLSCAPYLGLMAEPDQPDPSQGGIHGEGGDGSDETCTPEQMMAGTCALPGQEGRGDESPQASHPEAELPASDLGGESSDLSDVGMPPHETASEGEQLDAAQLEAKKRQEAIQRMANLESRAPDEGAMPPPADVATPGERPPPGDDPPTDGMPPPENVPPAEDVPPPGNVPPAEDVPPPADVPPAEDVLPPGDEPPAEDVPRPADVPPAEDVPPTGKMPQQGEMPSIEDGKLPTREASSAGDMPQPADLQPEQIVPPTEEMPPRPHTPAQGVEELPPWEDSLLGGDKAPPEDEEPQSADPSFHGDIPPPTEKMPPPHEVQPPSDMFSDERPFSSSDIPSGTPPPRPTTTHVPVHSIHSKTGIEQKAQTQAASQSQAVGTAHSTITAPIPMLDKKAVVALHGVFTSLVEGSLALLGETREASSRGVVSILELPAPLGLIVVPFVCFMVVLLFFRSLGVAPVPAAAPAQAAPVQSFAPAGAASSDAVAALTKQVQTLQQQLQWVTAELQNSTAQSSQAVAHLSAEMRAMNQQRAQIEEELLLSAKEVLECLHHDDGQVNHNQARDHQPPSMSSSPAPAVALDSAFAGVLAENSSVPAEQSAASLASPADELARPVGQQPICTANDETATIATPATSMMPPSNPAPSQYVGMVTATDTVGSNTSGSMQSAPGVQFSEHSAVSSTPSVPLSVPSAAPGMATAPPSAPPSAPSAAPSSTPSVPSAPPSGPPSASPSPAGPGPVGGLLGGPPASEAAGDSGSRPPQQLIQASGNPFARPQPKTIQASGNPFGRPQPKTIVAAKGPFGMGS